MSAAFSMEDRPRSAWGSASNIIKNHNIKAADKTANERGFLSTKDRMKIKNADLNYYVTNEIYNSHVN